MLQKELRIVDVLWKSASIKETPGANMEDAGQQIIRLNENI